MEKSKKQKLFSSLVEEWTHKTWLGWWNIKVAFHNSLEFARHTDECDDPETLLATCESDWRYMTAAIHVNVDLLEEQDEADIEEYVVHELMHIILREMHEQDMDHEERVATFLARSFITAAHYKK